MVELYDFQKQAVEELVRPEKHILIATMGSGKGSIAIHWLASTTKKHWLFVTTPSKRDSGDVQNEAIMWLGEDYMNTAKLEVISWAKLAKWTISNWDHIDDYAFVFDEVFKGKSGTSSAQGRAFLQITKRTDCWTGYTGTPGDRWIDFQAYFIAGHYIKNKTQFLREFCQMQTFKGYPEIVGYHDTETLKRWWERMTVCPDTSRMYAELPPERHLQYKFRLTPEYKRVAKSRTLEDGTLLDTSGAYCAALRRLSFTKQKQQWLTDYLEGLDTNTVIFYQFTETGDRVCELAAKALPKEAHVWRVCGKTHDIPTADTIGPRDIVVCQWQAGAEALNLQFMHEWVSVEPNYSYSTSVQARGRIKRIGQEHPQVFRYLVCEAGIEKAIYEALRTKSDFAEENWVSEQEGGDGN